MLIMHIVFVCSEYPYEANQPTGGFGRYVETISRGLACQGQTVTVLCRANSRLPKRKVDGVEIIPLVPFGKPLLDVLGRIFPVTVVNRLVNFAQYPILWSFTVSRELVKLKIDRRIDIIEGGDFGAELFFYLLFDGKTLTVIKLHTPSFVIRQFNDEPKTIFYRVMELMEKFCLKRARSLNSPSLSLAKIVSQEIRQPVTDVIPYPVEIKKIKIRKKRDPYLVFYAGKFQPKKGVFTLLQAIPFIRKKLNKAKFIFVGPDTIWKGKSVKESIKDFIAKNALENIVTIYDEITKDELTSLYQQAAVTVIPSIWENFPNVCLEAFVNSSAVVASKVGGLVEMINGEKNGLLVESRNPRRLADAIIILLTDKRLRSKIVRQAKRMAKQRFNLEIVTKSTLSLYQRCIDSKSMREKFF